MYSSDCHVLVTLYMYLFTVKLVVCDHWRLLNFQYLQFVSVVYGILNVPLTQFVMNLVFNPIWL